ncbi:MAG: transposase [Bacteroidales bacterium]
MGQSVGRSKRVKRPKKGYFHIILKSNYQSIIFEDSHDSEMFIELFNLYSKKYSTSILGWTLMQTHAHIILKSKELSKFMAVWLREFSRYYNRRHKSAGNIFIKPFSSYLIENYKNLIETVFYLYYNPLAEGICNHPKNYEFCSFNSHFKKDKKIDTTIIDNHFENYKDFENSFFDYVKLKSKNIKMVDERGRMTNAPLNMGTGFRPYTNKKSNTDIQVLEFRDKLLKGRSLSELNTSQIDDIIAIILTDSFANKRQIASVMMVHYDHVRGVEKKLLKKIY